MCKKYMELNLVKYKLHLIVEFFFHFTAITHDTDSVEQRETGTMAQISLQVPSSLEHEVIKS